MEPSKKISSKEIDQRLIATGTRADHGKLIIESNENLLRSYFENMESETNDF